MLTRTSMTDEGSQTNRGGSCLDHHRARYGGGDFGAAYLASGSGDCSCTLCGIPRPVPFGAGFVDPQQFVIPLKLPPFYCWPPWWALCTQPWNTRRSRHDPTFLVPYFFGHLFFIGLFGVVTRKNAVGMLMGVELMLNSPTSTCWLSGVTCMPPRAVCAGWSSSSWSLCCSG